jgi:hypothetical protein
VGTAAAGAWGKAGLQLVDDDEAPRVTPLEVEEEEGGCGASGSGGQVGAAEEELAGQQIYRGRERRRSCRSLNVPAALARGKSCVGLQMLLATLRRVRRCSVYLLYAYLSTTADRRINATTRKLRAHFALVFVLQ